MSFTLDKAPKLFISKIQIEDKSIIYSGSFNKKPLIESNNLGYLITGAKFIYGRFLEVSQSDFSAVFQTDDKINVLPTNASFPVLDVYWGEIAELILDENRNWKKTYFKSTDANEFIKNNVSGWTQVGNSLPNGAEHTRLIKNGWDHEHCYLCMQKISEDESNNKIGYVDEKNTWICHLCYTQYIEKRSLDFISINTI